MVLNTERNITVDNLLVKNVNFLCLIISEMFVVVLFVYYSSSVNHGHIQRRSPASNPPRPKRLYIYIFLHSSEVPMYFYMKPSSKLYMCITIVCNII